MRLVVEAIKGVKNELDTLPHLPDKLKRLPKLVGILASEILGLFSLIPYAVRTMALYRSIPDLEKFLKSGGQHAGKGVVIKRDAAYCKSERGLLDVYIPEDTVPREGESIPRPPVPVIFFIHGGVWSSGEKWHYAPMAVRLAQAGLMVVVPSYTLYPEAKAPQMIKEMSDALGWTFDNVENLGGDVNNITLSGHSAGAHLAAMVMLCHALAAAQKSGVVVKPSDATLSPAPADLDASSPGQRGSLDDPAVVSAELAATGSGQAGSVQEVAGYLHGAGTSFKDVAHSLAAVASFDSTTADGSARVAGAMLPSIGVADSRLPARFVGMAGVYDIAKHYEFERSRSVHEISMMKRAMNGISFFPALSPSVILGASVALAVLRQQQTDTASGHKSTSRYTPAGEPNFFSSFQLNGEAIPTRAGLSEGIIQTSEALPLPADLGFPIEAANFLPPSYVMTSCADHMVPWHEGAEMVASLQRVGAEARHCIYNHVPHTGYVMDWQPLPNKDAAAEAKAAGGDVHWGPHLRDFVKISHGHADLRRADLASAIPGQEEAGITPVAAAAAAAAIRPRRGLAGNERAMMHLSLRTPTPCALLRIRPVHSRAMHANCYQKGLRGGRV